MPTFVIVPPEPIVTPAGIPGTHAADDATVAAYIAAATAQIDGPTGWVGRAFGVQTLEYRTDGFPCREIVLPCPPVVSLTSITYRDASGSDQTIDLDTVELARMGGVIRLLSGSWPSTSCGLDALKVRYVAGYNGTSIADGGTGSLPPQVAQAISFLVQNMSGTATASQDLKVEEVEGIGRREYFTSRADASTLTKAADGLLAGLRVFR